VVCPGFAVDCLETLEEISVENAHLFIQAGGKQLNYIGALNDEPGHVAALARILECHAVRHHD
jgi:ferrochelatase